MYTVHLYNCFSNIMDKKKFNSIWKVLLEKYEVEFIYPYSVECRTTTWALKLKNGLNVHVLKKKKKIL